MGISLGPTFKGTYQLVPPPVVGFGFKKLKRGLKKAGRGVKKAGKGAYKLNKRVVKTTIKLHTKPLKVAAKAGKFAMRAMAKLAAMPIILIVNKLAGRRAKYLAFQRKGTTVTTLADKKAGGQYALNKLKGAGPVGKLAVKILKFTGGVTAGDTLGGSIDKQACRGWRQDAAMCGMTGAEIAAAAATIVAATTKLMKSLNRPGEAPANPQVATTETQAETVTQPVIQSDDAPTEENEDGEDAEGSTTEGAARRRKRVKQLAKAIIAEKTAERPPSKGRIITQAELDSVVLPEYDDA